MNRFVILLIMLLVACNEGKEKDRAQTEMIFQAELNKENVHNAFLAVYSPSHNIDWNFTGGHFHNGEKVTSNNPFYCASIGKTFTATAIAILKEKGELEFEDEIKNYLPEEIMQNLHMLDETDYSSEITIAHLLQHTSGLPDYFEGKTIDGSPNAMQLIFQDTTKFWSPTEMISLAKEKMKPLFAPGTGYNYSDTEYVLLGVIIENVSKMPLHDFLRERIFEPALMQNTSMYLRSKPIKDTGKMAEIWVGNYRIGRITSLSADWAGGGLVSTADDLVRFHTALNSGELVSESTLEEMKNWVVEIQGMYYGFGIRKIDFREMFHILPGLHIEGHSGATGSFMYYCPQIDLYISGTFNQSEEVQNSILFLAKIISVLKKDFHE